MVHSSGEGMRHQGLTLLGGWQCPQDRFPLLCDVRLHRRDHRFGNDPGLERGGVNHGGLEVGGEGMPQNAIGRGDDSTTCLGNDRVDSPVCRRDLRGPAGNVVEGVLRGVESVSLGDHVRDRFGFYFADTLAGRCAEQFGCLGWHEYVREFVSEGLDCLSIVDIGADSHLPAP